MVANLKVPRWKVLHQLLRTIVERRAVLDAEEARCLREAYAVQLWRQLGYIHMGEYLEREMGYGPQVGAERLRVARELGGLPQMEARLTAGELPYSAVRELTRIATGETEQAWIDEARGKNLRQIEAMVAGRKRGDRPSDPTTPELVHRVVRLELSPAAFAMLRQTQAAMADEHGGRLDDSAFIEGLCRRALEGAASADRPAHQIALTVCESCKRGWQNGAGREIDVAPEVIDHARCDAEWIGSLDATQPARVNSTVTARIRRQVFARDQHRCTVPGCRSARNLDLHHIEYQRDGGSHEMWNISVLCSGHHRELHDGTLSVRGTAPDHLTFSWHAATGAEESSARAAAADMTEVVAGLSASVERKVNGRDAGDTAVGEVNLADAGAAPAVGEVNMTAAVAATAVGEVSSEDPVAATAVGEVSSEGPVAATAVGEVSSEGPVAATAVGEVSSENAGEAGVMRSANGRDAAAMRAQELRNVLTAAANRVQIACVANRRAAGGSAVMPGAAGGNVAMRAANGGDDDAEPAVRDRDARDVLTAAGYSAQIALGAVATARSHVGDEATLEALVRAALQCCPMRGRGSPDMDRHAITRPWLASGRRRRGDS